MSTKADGKSKNQDKQDSRYKAPGYIRVTKALGMLDKGEGMKHWLISFKNYKEMQESLRLSAVRGSRVDEIVKQISTGQNLEQINVEPEYSKYVQAYLKWRQEWKFELLSADEEVYDDEKKYVGTLDMYGKLIHNGSPPSHVIIDVKTGDPGRNEDGSPKYAIYDNMHQQTAAYRQAKSKLVPVDANWILRLFSDGNYLFQPDLNYEKSFKIFDHCLAIAHLKNA